MEAQLDMNLEAINNTLDSIENLLTKIDGRLMVQLDAISTSAVRAARDKTPSERYKPRLQNWSCIGHDNRQWAAIFGTGIYDPNTVVGWGATPQAAMLEFDKAWNKAGGHSYGQDNF